MKLTASLLASIAGKPVNDNMRSIISGLDAYGAAVGLDKPHRLAHYIAQLGYESMGFRYDREIWGPTPAQERYDTRTDLGNTPEKDGDGKKYAGRAGIQITGRSNYQQFTDWCVDQGLNPPDFVKNPELVNTDPWEGLVPIWYWQTRKLNAYADNNDIEMITRRINGGMNGFADRLDWYTRTALVLAGYAPGAVKVFQLAAQSVGLLSQEASQIDGIAGAKTRAALHMTLAGAQEQAQAPVEAKPSPVVQEVETPVVVAPKGSDKTLWTRLNGAWLALAVPFSAFGTLSTPWKIALVVGVVLSIAFLLFKGEQIAARVKAVVKAFGE